LAETKKPAISAGQAKPCKQQGANAQSGRHSAVQVLAPYFAMPVRLIGLALPGSAIAVRGDLVIALPARICRRFYPSGHRVELFFRIIPSNHPFKSSLQIIPGSKGYRCPLQRLTVMVRPAGIEPARLAAGDFLTTSAFAAGLRRSWSGLYLHHSSRRRCPPSSLYTFPCGLGSVLAVKPSPNLTGSTPSVSRRALKLIKSPMSTSFIMAASRRF
jgi:hypothetical protein